AEGDEEESHARDIAAGAVETGHETELDGIGADRENDRNVSGCRFSSQRSRRAKRKDRGHGVGYRAATNAGNWAKRPSAEGYLIAGLRPSTEPASLRPC